MTTRTLQLRSEPDAVPAARRALAGLEGRLDPGLFFDVSLCVSELVTTAIRDIDAADDPLEMELSVSDSSLSAAIRRKGGVAFDRAPADAAGEDLGLHIISRLADRWGVDDADNRIWLEFDLGLASRSRAAAFEADRNP